MSLGWAVCQFRQDHNGKKIKKTTKLSNLLWFRFDSLAVTKIVITSCVLMDAPIHGIIWSFVMFSFQKQVIKKVKKITVVLSLSEQVQVLNMHLCFERSGRFKNKNLKIWKERVWKIWKTRVETATDLVMGHILRSRKLKTGSSRRMCLVLQKWVKKKKKKGTGREPFQATMSLKMRKGLCWPFRLFAGRELKLFLLRDKVKKIIIKQLHWNAANNTAFCFPGMV